MGKRSDLSEFDRGLVVGVRSAGLSVSAAATLLGFSRTTVSRVFREWSQRRPVGSGRWACGRKCLVDDRGRRRLDRLVRGDREATVAALTAQYNDGLQKGISGRTACRTLKRLGYSKTPLCPPPKPQSNPGQSHEGAANTGTMQQDDRAEASDPEQRRTDKGWQV